ncbi:MAG TPA: zinc ribbon domain-containing protein [Ktedonobacterales bacterium]
MTTCPNCGTEATAGDRFCQACGYPLTTDSAPPAPDLSGWADSEDPGLSMPIPMPPPPPPVVAPPGTPYAEYPVYPAYPSAPATPYATPYLPPAPPPSVPPYAPPYAPLSVPPSVPLAGYPTGVPSTTPPGAFASFANYQPAVILTPAPPSGRERPAATARRVWIVIGAILAVSLLAVYFASRGGALGVPAPSAPLNGTWFGPLAVHPSGQAQAHKFGYVYVALRQASDNTFTGSGAACWVLRQSDGITHAKLDISGQTAASHISFTATTAGNSPPASQFTGTWTPQTIAVDYQQPTANPPGSTEPGTLTMNRGTQSAYDAACQTLTAAQ